MPNGDSVGLYYEKLIWNDALTPNENTYIQISSLFPNAYYACRANDTLSPFMHIMLNVYDVNDVHGEFVHQIMEPCCDKLIDLCLIMFTLIVFYIGSYFRKAGCGGFASFWG